MTIWRGLLIIAAVVLTALIIRGFFAEDLFAAFTRIGSDPWGLTALVDLFLGFAITSSIFWLVETSKARALVLIIALFCLGNIVSAVWFAAKLPMIARQFGSRQT